MISSCYNKFWNNLSIIEVQQIACIVSVPVLRPKHMHTKALFELFVFQGVHSPLFRQTRAHDQYKAMQCYLTNQ